MPVFKLNPNRMDLPPGQSVEMNIEGCVDMYVRFKYLSYSFIIYLVICVHLSKDSIIIISCSSGRSNS